MTSEASDFLALSDRLVELDEKGANIERLLTAGVGINAEGGDLALVLSTFKKTTQALDISFEEVIF